ncbi:MAG: CDP-alcohol phosphatidyltransferase family protein [Coprobacillaceae bacterium]
MKEESKDKLLNIPNGLCFFRIALIPVFLYVYLNANDSEHYFIAAIVLVVSGFTDFLDGFIARKFDMITDFGKLIDPIADKLTQIAVAYALVYTYPLAWLLVAIIILKDGMLGIVGLYLFQYGVQIKGASWWGKIATAYFYLIVIILVAFYIPDTVLSTILIVSSFLLMLLAFFMYAYQLNVLNKNKDNSNNESKRD